jgi:hypothetical protein
LARSALFLSLHGPVGGLRQSSLASPSILTKISALRKKMSVNMELSERGSPASNVNKGSP